MIRRGLPAVLGVLIFLSLGSSPGCEETEATITVEQARPYLDQWAPSVEQTLREMAVAPAGKKDFKQRLQKDRARVEGQIRVDEPPYAVFVDQVYASLDYAFYLVAPGGLTERGEAVWKALEAVDTHALDPAPYPIDTIRARLDELAKANARFEELGSFALNDAEKEQALQWLTAQPVEGFEFSAQTLTTLTQAVLDSEQGQRMKAQLAEYETVSSEMATIEAELEHLLARGLVRYAHQMKHFRIRDVFIHKLNFDRWNDANISGRRPDKDWGAWRAQSVWRKAGQITDEISAATESDILYGRITQTLRDVLTGEGAAQTVAQLAPQQPQYAGLQKEYLRYRDIVQSGGWPKVEVQNNLKKGQRHAVAKALKVRLQREGYYPATTAPDDVYDDGLETAITAYQKTHQMEVSGRPHRTFWSSINVPAKRRMQQIGLNLQRWRASNIRHSDDIYVYANIPDFNVEIWDQQKRAMRFGLVVGNNETAIDEETKEKKYINRTPTVSAYIDRINYNPYWNVTPRIRENELLPQVRASVEAGYKAKIEGMLARRAPAAPAAQPDGSAAINTPRVDNERSLTSAGFNTGSTQPARPAAPQASRPNTDSYWSGGASTRAPTRFHVGALKKLLADSGEGDPDQLLASRFFYLNPETGVVDVSLTDKDHVPAWYAANNYEVMFPGNKRWEYIRELPGPHNSLGKVKVIFPNMYDIYLHDTPAKGLFRQDIRAYSHGCVRMEDPLGMAEYLLKKDGQWDDFDVPKILREELYEVIFLHRQVPVHVDYITVRVDDEGRANFLADIYNRDVFPDDAG